MITARGLTKRYRETLAVDDLSFEVRSGEVTVFHNALEYRGASQPAGFAGGRAVGAGQP